MVGKVILHKSVDFDHSHPEPTSIRLTLIFLLYEHADGEIHISQDMSE